jgi:CRISPR type III-A-associated RAMP protein Csm4
MQPALLIRLQPSGPWRYGASDGAHDQIDELYRSDRLFSAVTIAIQRLGFLEEWLDATARSNEPAVVFSSLYPYQGDTLFAIPPATLWPPPLAQITTPNSVFLAKIRWKTARFIPLSLVDLIITGGSLLADQWMPDPESGCLLRRDRPSTSPFRVVTRTTAAVDRLTHKSASAVVSACVEFEPGAGLWTIARYRDAATQTVWNERIEAAFRLLADTGFGGKRSSGWGQTHAPSFQRGAWPGLLLPKLGRLNNGAPHEPVESSRYWLLSLFSPGAADKIDWRSGEYTIAVRAGRVESGKKNGAEKKAVRMIAEGSVLIAPAEPAGAAVDVAPDHFEHPVFRSGLALALELPLMAAQALEEILAELQPVEEAATEEAIIEAPCDEPRDVQTPAEPEATAQREPEPAPQREPEPEPEPPYEPEPEPAQREPEPEPPPQHEPDSEPEPQHEPEPETPLEISDPEDPGHAL